MKVGDIRFHSVTDGAMKFDAGAWFGLIPKVMWSRRVAIDRKNRIKVGVNCLLLQTSGLTILVDTGLGTKHDQKRRVNFGLQTGKLLRNLRLHGLHREDIDIVVLSHLHWDHAGGTTYRQADGALSLTFPKARYIAQAADWEEATHANERNRAAYMPEDFEPLMDRRRLELVSGDERLAPGVYLKRTGGHTKGHQMVMVESNGQRAACLFDVMPTAQHLPLAWIASFDLYPMEVLERKRELLAQAERERWLLVFDHGLEEKAGYLERDGGQLRIRALAVE
ncbi:MAG: MBL fold metallo-hydrolase [Chloroflexi bacterium]|nr:MBL fold metallo-hydrolase [Chloroflexota bacterium]